MCLGIETVRHTDRQTGIQTGRHTDLYLGTFMVKTGDKFMMTTEPPVTPMRRRRSFWYSPNSPTASRTSSNFISSDHNSLPRLTD